MTGNTGKVHTRRVLVAEASSAIGTRLVLAQGSRSRGGRHLQIGGKRHARTGPRPAGGYGFSEVAIAARSTGARCTSWSRSVGKCGGGLGQRGHRTKPGISSVFDVSRVKQTARHRGSAYVRPRDDSSAIHRGSRPGRPRPTETQPGVLDGVADPAGEPGIPVSHCPPMGTVLLKAIASQSFSSVGHILPWPRVMDVTSRTRSM